jgi:hypothetical protein
MALALTLFHFHRQMYKIVVSTVSSAAAVRVRKKDKNQVWLDATSKIIAV